MKWIARLLVFAAAMFLGMAAASVFSGFRSNGLSNCVIELNAPAPTGIRVTYAGWDRDPFDSEPYLKFIIYNGLSRPVSYRAIVADAPLPRIEINGKYTFGMYLCGMGMKDHHINPGDSVVVRVQKLSFGDLPRKTDTITAEFYLKPEFSKEYETHTSEPFLLPDEFRESIKPIQY